MKARHYLQLVFAVGETAVRREYFELESPDETEEDALERWARAHPDMYPDGKPRQRYVEETLRRLRGSPLYTTLCRPSSWYRERAEAEGRPYPSPPSSAVAGKRIKRGR